MNRFIISIEMGIIEKDHNNYELYLVRDQFNAPMIWRSRMKKKMKRRVMSSGKLSWLLVRTNKKQKSVRRSIN